MLQELNIEMVILYLEQYGGYFLFLLVFLEYLKLPIFPSGIILPAAGMMLARENANLLGAVMVSLIAGLFGSLSSYGLGYYLGYTMLEKACKKSKGMQRVKDTTAHYMDRYGDKGLSLIRLVPVARTLVSVVAGSIHIKLVPFILYSAVGIFMWNLIFMFLGYTFANLFF